MTPLTVVCFSDLEVNPVYAVQDFQGNMITYIMEMNKTEEFKNYFIFLDHDKADPVNKLMQVHFYVHNLINYIQRWF